jgi:hypothetical protein
MMTILAFDVLKLMLLNYFLSNEEVKTVNVFPPHHVAFSRYP